MCMGMTDGQNPWVPSDGVGATAGVGLDAAPGEVSIEGGLADAPVALPAQHQQRVAEAGHAPPNRCNYITALSVQSLTPINRY